jgi:hypothetical protein
MLHKKGAPIEIGTPSRSAEAPRDSQSEHAGAAGNLQDARLISHAVP